MNKRRTTRIKRGESFVDNTVVISFCPNILYNGFVAMPLHSSKGITLASEFFFGVCLLADISGFVKLSGSLCKAGVDGIDDLQQVTSKFIGDLVRVVYHFGGDVISFAGDAIICIFYPPKDRRDQVDECCRKAIRCAVELKDMSSLDLKCHVGLSCGEICFGRLGGYNNEWVYMINGDCLNEISSCINDAGPSEAVATRALVHLTLMTKERTTVTDGHIMEELDSGNYRILSPEKNSIRLSVKGRDVFAANVDVIGALQSFIPPPVRSAIQVGSFKNFAELREVTTMFIKLDSYSIELNRDVLTLQPFLLGMQELLFETGGFLRQFLVDDKGCVLIAMWGVPLASYPNNCSRATCSAVNAFHFARDNSYEVSIGVTTGLAYCGTIGNSIRQDYVAMGDSVNLSARLMGKAKGRVIIDDNTYSRLPASMMTAFTQAESMLLKGRSEPMTPYYYNETPLSKLPKRDEDVADTKNVMISDSVMTVLVKELDKLATYVSLVNPNNANPAAQTPDISSMEETGRNPSFHIEMRTDSASKITRIGSGARIPSTRCILAEGSSGMGQGQVVDFFRTGALSRSICVHVVKALHADSGISYGLIRKLFITLIGQHNFSTETIQQQTIENLLRTVYAGQKFADVVKIRFPVVKVALQLEWDFPVAFTANVKRPSVYQGDTTLRDLFRHLFQQRCTAVIIENGHFCDELSWKELKSYLDLRLPLVFLITICLPGDDFKSQRRQSFNNKLQLQQQQQGQDKEHPSPAVPLGQSNNSKSFRGLYKSFSYRTPERKTLFSKYGFRAAKNGARAAFAAHKNCLVVKLTNLSEDEVRDLLMATMQAQSINEHFFTVVYELTGGNPFWVTSIARFAKTSEVEQFTQSLAKAGENILIGHDPHAKQLQHHILCVMDTLAPEHQTILKYASVIGDEFHVDVLQSIVPFKLQDNNKLYNILSLLSDVGLLMSICDSPPVIYAFQNELLRQTIYDLALPSETSTLHKKIAICMENMFEDNLRPYYASLAYHYAMSGSSRGLAFKYTVKAADQSLANSDFTEGQVYLMAAQTLVKYESELTLLIRVVETALYDMRPRTAVSKTSSRIVPLGSNFCPASSEEELEAYEKLVGDLSDALEVKMLNGTKIVSDGLLSRKRFSVMSLDFEHEEKMTETNSEKSEKHVGNASIELKSLPSYSARHPRNLKKGLFRNVLTEGDEENGGDAGYCACVIM